MRFLVHLVENEEEYAEEWIRDYPAIDADKVYINGNGEIKGNSKSIQSLKDRVLTGNFIEINSQIKTELLQAGWTSQLTEPKAISRRKFSGITWGTITVEA